MDRFETDVAVIGAGVLGLAVAAALARAGREVIVVEKNDAIGAETSSRNSEVIHAGLYYPPGSAKARFCIEGREALYDWCAKTGAPARQLGKLIVANGAEEEEALARILERAHENGATEAHMISGAAARALEPALRVSAALSSPRTGVVDSHAFMLSLLGEAENHGAALALETTLARGWAEPDGPLIELGGAAPARLKARLVVIAAGLWSERALASIEGVRPEARPTSLYYKGNYFALSGARAPFSHLIYPAPQPGGLGVHLTLDLAGAARFGPDVEPLAHNDPSAIDYAVDPNRAAPFAAAIRRYWPGLPDDALRPDYAGVRPKIGADYDNDFKILGPDDHGAPGLISLHGFESPALTASLAIGDAVADRARQLS